MWCREWHCNEKEQRVQRVGQDDVFEDLRLWVYLILRSRGGGGRKRGGRIVKGPFEILHFQHASK